MRIVGLVAVGVFLAGCVTSQPSGVRVVGLVWLVSGDDMREAIAADQAEPHPGRTKAIDHAEVISRSEIQIFHEPGYPGYDQVRRIHGKWRLLGRVIVLDFIQRV
jgi:hypothetical protein